MSSRQQNSGPAPWIEAWVDFAQRVTGVTITKRERAEIALRESQARFAALGRTSTHYLARRISFCSLTDRQLRNKLIQ